LTDDERETIRRWFDPQHPPDASTYYRWVRRIKEWAHDMPHTAQKSLVELGIEISGLTSLTEPSE
jgi:acyl-CoA oxidase